MEKQIIDETESSIFLLVFGSPLIANDRPAGDQVGEKTRSLVFDLINRKKKYFLIVSGEIHYGEITQLNFYTQKNNSSDLYEIISSGLTHTTSFGPVISDVVLDTFNV